jgi:hypothetical protein
VSVRRFLLFFSFFSFSFSRPANNNIEKDGGIK